MDWILKRDYGHITADALRQRAEQVNNTVPDVVDRHGVVHFPLAAELTAAANTIEALQKHSKLLCEELIKRSAR